MLNIPITPLNSPSRTLNTIVHKALSMPMAKPVTPLVVLPIIEDKAASKVLLPFMKITDIDPTILTDDHAASVGLRSLLRGAKYYLPLESNHVIPVSLR